MFAGLPASRVRPLPAVHCLAEVLLEIGGPCETFEHITHQLCCAHLLRDLAAAGETYPGAIWAGQIADALRALIHATNLACENGHDRVDPDERAKQLHLLRQGVLAGLSATTGHGNAPGENKARLLLEAFRDRRTDILRFVDDLTVPPPTSNDAERGLRPSKIQQKISGRLTSVARTEDRHRILGYLTTAAKHGLDRFAMLLDMFYGRIWIPDAATRHLTDHHTLTGSRRHPPTRSLHAAIELAAA